MTAGTDVCRSIVLGALAATAACGRVDFKVIADAADDALAAPVPDACSFGPWTTASVPQPFARVNDPSATDWGVEVSGDGKRLVFSSDRFAPEQQGSNFDLYITQRTSLADDFDAPTRLPISSDTKDDKDPSLTEDALELYFVSDRGDGSCLYVSSRQKDTDPWGPPRRLDAVCISGPAPGGPYVSRDGLRLYYDNVQVMGELRMISRGDRSSDFSQLQVVLTLPGLRYCALDDPELTVYCENVLGIKAQLWRATRPSTDAGFSPPEPIAELGNDGQFEDGDPSFYGHGTHLVFASTRGSANNSSDLFVAARTCQ